MKLPLILMTVYSIISMKLNIPKCQCSFTLLATVCIVVGVTSFLVLSGKYFWIFSNNSRLRLHKMNPQSFRSTATGNSKLIYWNIFKPVSWKYWKNWIKIIQFYTLNFLVLFCVVFWLLRKKQFQSLICFELICCWFK